jgi:hypothetical protein
MSKANGGEFDKMSEFIESIFNVFKMVNKKADTQNDKRLKMISLVIFNYVRKMAKDYNVSLKELSEPDAINLIPVFEYISYNNIELYDFTKIDVTDLDVTKNSDLERFVLTHVYYITQKI